MRIEIVIPADEEAFQEPGFQAYVQEKLGHLGSISWKVDSAVHLVEAYIEPKDSSVYDSVMEAFYGRIWNRWAQMSTHECSQYGWTGWQTPEYTTEELGKKWSSITILASENYMFALAECYQWVFIPDELLWYATDCELPEHVIVGFLDNEKFRYPNMPL